MNMQLRLVDHRGLRNGNKNDNGIEHDGCRYLGFTILGKEIKLKKFSEGSYLSAEKNSQSSDDAIKYHFFERFVSNYPFAHLRIIKNSRMEETRNCKEGRSPGDLNNCPKAPSKPPVIFTA